MKADLNLASIIYDWSYRNGISGRILTLGSLELSFSIEELFANLVLHEDHTPTGMRDWNAKHLFRLMGFRDTLMTCIEGAEEKDFTVDISSFRFPPKHRDKYDLVINAGVLEEVFHLPNALANLTHFTAVDGAILHLIFRDRSSHGSYYDISPSLFVDYYSSSGFEICESALISTETDGGSWQVDPMPVWANRAASSRRLRPEGTLYAMLVRRNNAQVDRKLLPDRMSSQSVSGFCQPRWFIPYKLKNGVRSEPAGLLVRPLREFSHVEGAMWSCAAPELVWCCDTESTPDRSPLVLLENEISLGPGNCQHSAILKNGCGFSHWGGHIFFAPGSPGDPNLNGKRYFAVLPGQPRDG